jgi:CheY-like chemotaxis protein
MRYKACRPLVAEDDPGYQPLLRRVFEKAGISRDRLRLVADGDAAIAALEKADPDALLHAGLPPSLVILDLSLPGRTGLEVLEWIRQRPALAAVPVFILTSSEKPDDIGRAFELRADSYFVKPSTIEELQMIVEGMLGYWHVRVHRRLPGSVIDPRIAGR